MAMSMPPTARFAVRIEDTGETYRCADTRSLLEGMEALGRKGIPVGCRNGGCGVCKVQIRDGRYVSRVMSRDHVSEEDERDGRVLACRVRPCSDLSLSVIGLMRKSVCRSDAGSGRAAESHHERPASRPDRPR